VPIIVFVSIMSSEVANLLTGGRYPDAGGYIVAFMPILMVQTLRSVTSLTALALENARTPLVATYLSLLGLLIGLVSSNYYGAYEFCLGLAMSGLIYSVWVIKILRGYELSFSIEPSGYINLALAAFFTAFILMHMNLIINLNSSVILIIYPFITVGIYLFVSYVIKPFNEIGRDTLNRLLKRKVFVR
jgi:O-antigen/teichoic acid export membrane protein